MRIAYIINSLEGGGAAFPVPSILSLMRDYGAEVKIFALTRKNGKALISIQKALLPVAIRDGGVKDHLKSFLWLNEQIQAFQPTHLWTSLTRATLLGQLIGLKQKIPVVSWQHAAYLKPWNLRLLKATHSLTQLWLGDSQKITQLTQQRLKISKDNIITWPIFKTNPMALKAYAWQPDQLIKIASVGRLHPVKGYDILIQACKILNQRPNIPAYQISIYGEGDEYQKLHTLIHQYQLQKYIKLMGFNQNIEQILTQYHLYVQPSRSEGFCVAAHEAMQAGLPIIASAVGELSFSIENHKTGLTIPPEDPLALADALYELLTQPNNLYSMGLLARKTVMAHFSAEHFNNIGRNVFDRMLCLTSI